MDEHPEMCVWSSSHCQFDRRVVWRRCLEELRMTRGSTRLPQEQWQNVVRRQTFMHRTGECIEDLRIMPGKEYAFPLRGPAMDILCRFYFIFGRFRHVKLSRESVL